MKTNLACLTGHCSQPTRVLLLLITLVLSACHSEPPPPVKTKSVRVIMMNAHSAAETRQYAGEVRARFETPLAFRVPGKVASRLVDAGAVVKRGQPLARIDAADFALQLQQAEAQSQLAALELKRFRDLRSKNFVSQAALDAKEAAATAARAQTALLRNQTAYTTLSADRDGVITAVLAEAGQVVAAGQPIFRLAPDGDREVAIQLPESQLKQIPQGTLAEVQLWAENNKEAILTGQVREIASAADPATRTYAARVALPKAPARLPVGLSATVRLTPSPVRADNQFELPLSAIFQQGNHMAVWKVGADDMVKLAPVIVDRYEGNHAIVTQGVTQGEKIVTAGVIHLRAGEKVHPIEARE
jgi:RND family efflux transporter MFP subunit